MNVYSLTNFLKEYCNTKVPKEFSHYTSTEALINIFKSNSLRFTDCEFLNDSEEYVYVDNLLFNDERYFQEEKVRKFLDDCEDSVYFDANLISEFDGYYKKKEMNIKKHKYYVYEK